VTRVSLLNAEPGGNRRRPVASAAAADIAAPTHRLRAIDRVIQRELSGTDITDIDEQQNDPYRDISLAGA